ncbi:TlpA family protein disulfide reductase [Bacteroidota bacterium]
MRGIIFAAILFITAQFSINTFAQEISVEIIDEEKLAQLINERNGRALFLNIWATWCIPCREEFPDIVQLSEKYKGGPIDFYGISIDYPDEVASKIIPFLKLYHANFTNFVNGFKKDEMLINLLDEKWSGALPATFIFDKAGNKVSFLAGKKKYNLFEEEIKKVL